MRVREGGQGFSGVSVVSAREIRWTLGFFETGVRVGAEPVFLISIGRAFHFARFSVGIYRVVFGTLGVRTTMNALKKSEGEGGE